MKELKGLLRDLLELHEQELRLQEEVSELAWKNEEALAEAYDSRLSEQEAVRLHQLEHKCSSSSVQLQINQEMDRMNDLYSFLGKKGTKVKIFGWASDKIGFEFDGHSIEFDLQTRKFTVLGESRWAAMQGEVQPSWAFQISQEQD